MEGGLQVGEAGQEGIELACGPSTEQTGENHARAGAILAARSAADFAQNDQGADAVKTIHVNWAADLKGDDGMAPPYHASAPALSPYLLF